MWIAIARIFAFAALPVAWAGMILFEVRLSQWFGVPPGDLKGQVGAFGFVGAITASLATLAVAGVLLRTRGAALTGKEQALYWMGCALSIWHTMGVFFDFMGGQWFGQGDFSRAASGWVTGSLLVLASAVLLARARGAALTGGELRLYWLGCAVTFLFTIPAAAAVMNWPWLGPTDEWRFRNGIVGMLFLILPASGLVVYGLWRRRARSELSKGRRTKTLLALAAVSLLAVTAASLLIKPDDHEVLNSQGVAWWQKGEFDRAIEDYTAALRIKADYHQALYNRGLAWSDKGDLDRAIEDYTAALRIKPDEYQALNNRGNAWLQKGEYDRAIQDSTAALRLKPDSYLTLSVRGDAWLQKGEHDRAIEDLTAALRINADYHDALNSLVWVLATAPAARLRDGPRAVRLAERAVSLLDDRHTREHLAAAYAEAGRFRDAVDAQERALSVARAESSSANDIAAAEDRLRLYREGRPYREQR